MILARIFGVIVTLLVTLIKIAIEIILVPFRVIFSLYKSYKKEKYKPTQTENRPRGRDMNYEDFDDDWEDY